MTFRAFVCLMLSFFACVAAGCEDNRPVVAIPADAEEDAPSDAAVDSD